MAKMLYVQASPRIERSHSIAVADVFIEEYQKANSGDAVEKINLFEQDMPAFDGPVLQSKYVIMHGEEATKEQKQAWKQVEEIIEHFKSFDKYVFAVPMWNFGIPYRLKHYLDILIQPTYTFGFTDNGDYKGLVTGKPAFVAYARGGNYSKEAEGQVDFQKRYLELALGFIGFETIHSVIAQPTLAEGPEGAKTARQDAIEQARKLAAAF